MAGEVERVRCHGAARYVAAYARPIVHRALTGDALVDLLASPFPREPSIAGEVLVVDRAPSGGDGGRRAAARQRLATTPCVVVAIGEAWDAAHEHDLDLVDVVADEGELADIVATATLAPLATVAFALHLRNGPARSPQAGLVAESALYSTLQGGPELASWRSRTPVRTRASEDGPAVVVTRRADTLQIELARPDVHNALDARMRDEFLDALAIAVDDPDLQVVVSGQGPSFCSGGDLDEFGTFADPATAHTLRLDRSIGAVLLRIADRTTFHLHGSCCGSGIELAAFAGPRRPRTPTRRSHCPSSASAWSPAPAAP